MPTPVFSTLYVPPTTSILGTSLRSVPRATWFFEPEHRRSVFMMDGVIDVRRFVFPSLLFGVFYRGDGVPTGLTVSRCHVDDAAKLRPDVSVLDLPWLVCLGERAARRVDAGLLDPIDAFWLTAFKENPVHTLSGLIPSIGKRRSVIDILNQVAVYGTRLTY